MKQSDFPVGALVSYQCAGMPEPEYGVVMTYSRIPGHVFVRYGNDQHGKLTDTDFLQLGRVPSWWSRDENGRWRSDRTPRT